MMEAMTQPRILFLGTGTSAGVPVIGCDCRTCTSSDPRDNRLRTSSSVSWIDPDGQDRLVLIDTSPDLRQQVLRHGLARCDAILYTHNHVDHTFGLDETRRFNMLMQAPIDVYAEASTMESLHRVYRHIFKKEQNVNASFVATLIPNVIDDEAPIDLFGLRFTPLRFLHGRLPVLGFRIEALDRDEPGKVAAIQPPPLPFAWCTDVSAIPPETWGRLEGVRTLALDLLRIRKHPTHFSFDEAVAAADQIGAEQTWFIHMTHDIHHSTHDDELPDGMSFAFDGLELGGPSA